jgi:putative membrane protein
MSIGGIPISSPIFFAMIFNFLMLALVIIGLVVVIAWVARKIKGDNGKVLRPLNIAKERFARGEISKQELEEIKRNLK